jgi:hypothetical protein
MGGIEAMTPQKHAAAVDVERLRKLAEAATPGPWMWNEVYECVHSHANADSLFPVCRMSNNRPVVENMHFIAAANPAAILALIDRLAAAEKEVAYQRTTMLAAKQEIDEHWQAHCDADGFGPANLMRRLEAKAVCYPGHCETQRILSAEVDRLKASCEYYCDLRVNAEEALAASEKRASEYRKALEQTADWLGLGKDANERYEYDAGRFHMETGYMAPGKDDRSNLHSREDREHAWKTWHAKERDKIYAMIAKALADPQHGGGEG